MEKNISNLAIEATEELTRLRKNMPKELTNATILSDLIQTDFSWRFDYSSLFSEAYFSAYNKEIPTINNGKTKRYQNEISWKLTNPDKLNENTLDKLINFCKNLSDYASEHEKIINEIKSYSNSS